MRSRRVLGTQGRLAANGHTGAGSLTVMGLRTRALTEVLAERSIVVPESSRMTHTVDSWRGKLSAVVVLTVMIFVATVRPVARPVGRLCPHLGLARMSLLSRPADHTRVGSQPPVEGETRSLLPRLGADTLLLVLKTQRAPRHALRVRRLRLPLARSYSSPSSDQH